MILPIKVFPAPILREKCKKIEVIDSKIKSFCSDLKQTLEADKIRVGLAANQVGRNWRIIAVKEKGDVCVVINPEIIDKSEEMIEFEEGCLSFPEIFGKVLRHKKIKIKGLTPEGKKLKLTKIDLPSVVFQHETDHLEGILLIDKAIPETLYKHRQEEKIEVVFLGNSECSLPILKSLNKNTKINVSYVVCGCDKKCGRGLKTQCSPAKKLAQSLKIPVIETENINSPEIQKLLEIINPNYYATASFGQILKQWLLYDKKKRLRSLNIHPSLLPKYRGATPVQSAILNGDVETGVTIMLMTEGLDEGPILWQQKLKINEIDNTKTLFEKAFNLASENINSVLLDYHAGKIKSKNQDGSKATFSKKIIKEDGKIDWKKSSFEIDCQIRAYSIWPTSYTVFKNKMLKILNAKISDIQVKSGLVKQINGKVLVGTKKGSLELLKVQLEGKQAVDIKDFISGYKDLVGSKLI